MRAQKPFPGIFIRAPVVEKVLPTVEAEQVEEQKRVGTVVAPSRRPGDPIARAAMGNHVEVLAKLPGRVARLAISGVDIDLAKDTGDIVAVRQGNVFGTSFHPELTNDPRIHVWWLCQVREAVVKSRAAEWAAREETTHLW